MKEKNIHQMPAFCDNCGAIFPSGFAFGGAANVTLVGNKSGPCPRCGGMGSVPDGVFSFVGDVVNILSAPNVTIERLRRLSKITIEHANRNVDAVLDSIQKELPELKEKITQVKNNKGNIVTWLTLLILTIQTIIAAAAYYSGKGPTKDEIQKMINDSINKSYDIHQNEKKSPSLKKLKRNEPCNCGSGIKYKKCCGRLI